MGTLIIEIPEKKIKEEWNFNSYEEIEDILKRIKAMIFIEENSNKVINSIEVENISEEDIHLQL